MLIQGSIGSDTLENSAEITMTPEHVTVTASGFQAGTDVWFRIVYHYDPPVLGNFRELTIAGKNNADDNGSASTGQLPRNILPSPATTVSCDVSDKPIG